MGASVLGEGGVWVWGVGEGVMVLGADWKVRWPLTGLETYPPGDISGDLSFGLTGFFGGFLVGNVVCGGSAELCGA